MARGDGVVAVLFCCIICVVCVFDCVEVRDVVVEVCVVF